MKRKMCALLCFAFLLFSSEGKAQTADDIITKHIAAMGGQQKILAMKTLIMKAEINLNNIKIPTTVYRIHNKAFRVDMNVMGSEGFRIITNDSGWVFMPFMGHEKPQPLPKKDLAAAQDILDIHGLIDYKQKNYKAEYKGKENMDGKSYYVVKITKPNGNETEYYFDEKYLAYKVEETSLVNNEKVTQTTTYDAFNKTADGLVYASSWTNQDGKTTVQKFEVNPTINASVFKPAKK